MRIVAAADVDRLLNFPSLIDALHTAFTGDLQAPERHHHAVGTGADRPIHLLMPAWTGDAPKPGSFLGTKIVNVFPGNAGRGLPAVLGTYLLHDGATGAPLAAIDGTRLTHWRTAGASGLASRLLAAPAARHLVMVGAGALAPFLIRAHASVRPLERISIWNRRRHGADQLAARLVDLPVEVVDDLEAAVAEADIVSCATLSGAPLVKGAWLRPGVHLDLVGAFTLAMREADDAALQRGEIYIDTPAALTEGGDVAIALRSGAVTPAAIRANLHDLCRGTAPGRTDPQAVTVFKSVGTAIEDLAAAMLVWRAVQADDAGRGV